MNKTNLFFNYDIGQLHSLMDKKELHYKDIIEECARRTNEVNDKYFMWECFDQQKMYDQADAITRNIEYLKGLTYMPLAVKDIFNTQFFPTQMGSPLWKGFTPGNDARVVHNLKEAGAIVAGKSVTAEFAVHALNKTLNHHDVTLTPGTSSSGSAVAIALGVVPIALGTQTAGSIVRPSSFCGIYGFKPSFGLIPRTGMLKTTDSLDTIGFFTIHFKDLLRVFEAVRVHGRDYPLSNQALKDPNRQNKLDSRPWRVAFIKTYTWGKAESYAKESMLKYIDQLNRMKNIEVEMVDLPSEFDCSHDVHATIYNKTLFYYFKKEYQNAELVSDIMIELIEDGQKITLSDYSKAIEMQNRLIASMDQLMQEYDVLISLSTAGIAPLRNVIETPDPSLIWSLLHLPVIAVPAFTNGNNLPFGFQVCSRKYNDYKLLHFLGYLYDNNLIPRKMNPLSNEGQIKQVYA